ncbi:predicted protein [Naegleria gruberi]|uniref:Predicted protein n=1 Tax=Naegleria gruberi TaxID=5762 RepID=D2VMX5_NAEGR|nr:uncharacterized protein NAEGRDRAFT_50876 [Naegleria gruberi]EFC41899.1 predicted protein [Naegleria gruberi]|eukprot:XP_002674643.1 predicted protein [Naegleria gruberi strain NEG-M]
MNVLALSRWSRLVLAIYLFILMVVSYNIQHVCAKRNEVSIIEWKGLVLIKESLNIPQDSILSIKDNAQVVFYSSSNVTQPITININGSLEIGKHVQFMSLDVFQGTKPVPSFNNEMWSFVLDGQTRRLDLDSVSVIKSQRLKAVQTFDIQQSLDSIKLSNCTMNGGYNLFRIISGEHVFHVTESKFENMQTVLLIALPENACRVTVSNCYFSKIGNTFVHKGSDNKNAKNSFTVENTVFDNVGQGINSERVSLKLTNVDFKWFKSGIVSYNITAFRVKFDNFNMKESGIAIANNQPDVSNGVFDIQQCTFQNIHGLAVFMNYNMKLFRFTNNKVINLTPSSGLPSIPLNLIGGPLFNFDSVVFEQNEIVNCQVNGFYSIVNFDNIGALSFVRNTLTGNSGKCSLTIKNAINNNLRIEKNIFDSVETVNGDVCVQKANSKLNVSLNYWGKKVDKSLKLTTSEMNEIISTKLSPSKYFEFVPYYLTSNVNDNDASNLGGYITPEPSKNSDNLGIIIGASIGGAALLLVIVGVIILTLVFYNRKKRAYTEISSI